MSLRAGTLWWDQTPLLRTDELALRGPHNVRNAMAAAAVALARGLPIDAVRAGLKSFAGVPHRLEEIAVRDGVIYVNDSKATNVAAALVALASLRSESTRSWAAKARRRTTRRCATRSPGTAPGST